MQQKFHKGFSLIELSIALIIVGLVIGSVIIGRDMARKGEISAVVSETGQIISAWNSFLDQFGQYPGDFQRATEFWPSAVANGDGDTYIDEVETPRVWQHMTLANVYPGTFTGAYSGGSLKLGVNVPESKMKKCGYEIDFTCDPPPGTPCPHYGRTGNVIVFGQERGANNDIGGPALTPAEARAIDLKIDDGGASTGKYIGLDAAGSPAWSCTGPYNVSSAEYQMDRQARGCRTFFWLD